MASWSRVVWPWSISHRAAAMKSAMALGLLGPLPAACQPVPASPPPRTQAMA
nr:hypothetical protein [Actinomadura macra]